MSLLHDIRYAFRALSGNRGFAMAAILCTALGVGLTTSIFSAVHATLIRPLPFADPDQLVAVYGVMAKQQLKGTNISYSDFVDWRDQNRSFAQLGMYSWSSPSFTGQGVGGAERVDGAEVTASDLVPEMLEAGKARAEQAGVELEWAVADAENLPFDDDSFDVVMSSIGAMFAPHHQEVADELARVCRPGGTIGLLSWTPEGMIGGLFRTMGPFAPPPPPGAQPAPLWGSEDHLRELFGDRVEGGTLDRANLEIDERETRDGGPADIDRLRPRRQRHCAGHRRGQWRSDRGRDLRPGRAAQHHRPAARVDHPPQVDACREGPSRTGEHDRPVPAAVERAEGLGDRPAQLDVKRVDLAMRQPHDRDVTVVDPFDAHSRW
jgi:SAM-dependent methyltransferase